MKSLRYPNCSKRKAALFTTSIVGIIFATLFPPGGRASTNLSKLSPCTLMGITCDSGGNQECDFLGNGAKCNPILLDCGDVIGYSCGNTNIGIITAE